jgi:hypothetical protein
VCLEWGTIDAVSVVEALRADNWLHQHGDPTGPDAPAIKAQLRAAFAPDDTGWADSIWTDFSHYMEATMSAVAH